MIAYDESEARKTDRAYQTPDVTRQRMRTLAALQLKAGEFVLDVGCGSGLLTHDMATLVGAGGCVIGVDTGRDRSGRRPGLNAAALSLERERVAGLLRGHHGRWVR